jgi:hypothetical protein
MTPASLNRTTRKILVQYLKLLGRVRHAALRVDIESDQPTDRQRRIQLIDELQIANQSQIEPASRGQVRRATQPQGRPRLAVCLSEGKTPAILNWQEHSLDNVTLVEANVNLAVIKQALGHKSIASTAIYTVPTDQSAGKAVTAALASMF